MKNVFVMTVVAIMAISCGSNQKQEQATQAAASQAKQVTIDSITTVNQQQKTIDSLQTVVDEKDKAKAAQKQPVVQTQTTTTTETKKESWSSTCKRSRDWSRCRWNNGRYGRQA